MGRRKHPDIVESCDPVPEATGLYILLGERWVHQHIPDTVYLPDNIMVAWRHPDNGSQLSPWLEVGYHVGGELVLHNSHGPAIVLPHSVGFYQHDVAVSARSIAKKAGVPKEDFHAWYIAQGGEHGIR